MGRAAAQNIVGGEAASLFCGRRRRGARVRGSARFSEHVAIVLAGLRASRTRPKSRRAATFPRRSRTRKCEPSGWVLGSSIRCEAPTAKIWKAPQAPAICFPRRVLLLPALFMVNAPTRASASRHPQGHATGRFRIGFPASDPERAVGAQAFSSRHQQPAGRAYKPLKDTPHHVEDKAHIHRAHCPLAADR